MDRRKAKEIAVNAIWFKIGWIGCVMYGNIAILAVIPVTLLIYTRYIPLGGRGWVFVSAIVLVGCLMDSLLAATGILVFPSGKILPPLWLLTVWVLFATLLIVSLPTLVKHRMLFAALSSVGGAFSYSAGIALGSTEFGTTYPVALVTLAASWLLASMAIHYVYKHIFLYAGNINE